MRKETDGMSDFKPRMKKKKKSLILFSKQGPKRENRERKGWLGFPKIGGVTRVSKVRGGCYQNLY